MNKKRLIISSVLSIFLVSIILIGSTYSIFTSQEIDETVNVYKTGDLSITYKTSGSIQTDPIPKNEEEADGITPYRITVTNTGNVPYQFDVILTDTTSSTDNTINYDYIMTKVGYLDTKPLSECTNNIIKEDVILLAGEAVDIDIRVWISDTVPNSELGKSFYAKLTIDGQAVYNDSKEINNDMLSLRYMKTSSASDFRNESYITYIKTASFVDYIDTSNASVDTTTNEKIMWDMTTNTTYNTNKVIAWLEDNGTTDDSGNKYYNLYIGSKEKIYTNNLANFLCDMTSLENISFTNLDTSLTTVMYGMFANCSSLTSLDLSSFDTSNVTQFSDYNANNINHGMFRGCSSLTSLDLSRFNTSSVVYMQAMFYGCSNLTSLDLSNFDTSSVITMAYMFYNCSSLTGLDFSSFDTSNVTNMVQMFENCSSLIELDVSNFNTSNVTSMAQMFRGCSSLTSLDLSSFDTSNVTDMHGMFQECSSLTSLDLSSFDASNVTNMKNMFSGCRSLTGLDLSRFNTSSVVYMQAMFYGCSNLISLDLSNFDTSNVTNMTLMFHGCSSLTSLNVSNFNTSNVTNMSYMFANCSNLTSLDLSNFDTSKVTDMSWMFNICYKLQTSIVIKNNNITHDKMFNGAATEEGASITVYYVGDNPDTTDVNESTESLVESMLATKSSNSNVTNAGCYGDYCLA